MNRVDRAENSATVATDATAAGQHVGLSGPAVHLEPVTGGALGPAGAGGNVAEVLIGVGDVVHGGDPMLCTSEDA